MTNEPSNLPATVPTTDLVLGDAAGTDIAHREAGAAVGMVQAEAEIKAAIILARQFPRDEQAAWVRLQRSCKRPTFAEGANYKFRRGKGNVTGPSVKLAREMKRTWGNLHSGVRIVSVDDRMVHVKGWAWDLETNARTESEAKFRKLVQRKQPDGSTQWVEPDERDLRELINRHGAICERNGVLALMPPDVVDEASKMCGQTMKAQATGDLEEDRERVLRHLSMAFDGFGVSTDMLAAYLGHSLDLIDAEELTELREIYTAIRDGARTREDVFDLGASAQPEQTAGAAATDLEDELRKAEAETATPEQVAKREAEKKRQKEALAAQQGGKATPSDDKPDAGGQQAAPQAKEDGGGPPPTQAGEAPEVANPAPDALRLHQGPSDRYPTWVGELPKLKDLKAVLAREELQVATVVLMWYRDTRKRAADLYYRALKARDVEDPEGLLEKYVNKKVAEQREAAGKKAADEAPPATDAGASDKGEYDLGF